ncbi:MAG: hypothetical protein ACOX88_06720 [Christensenellales bacterium]|jgi:hypothetical protein
MMSLLLSEDDGFGRQVSAQGESHASNVSQGSFFVKKRRRAVAAYSLFYLKAVKTNRKMQKRRQMQTALYSFTGHIGRRSCRHFGRGGIRGFYLYI